jgi:hypothetical protein
MMLVTVWWKVVIARKMLVMVEDAGAVEMLGAGQRCW